MGFASERASSAVCAVLSPWAGVGGAERLQLDQRPAVGRASNSLGRPRLTRQAYVGVVGALKVPEQGGFVLRRENVAGLR
jgi:hypothetical protein